MEPIAYQRVDHANSSQHTVRKLRSHGLVALSPVLAQTRASRLQFGGERFVGAANVWSTTDADSNRRQTPALYLESQAVNDHFPLKG